MADSKKQILETDANKKGTKKGEPCGSPCWLGLFQPFRNPLDGKFCFHQGNLGPVRITMNAPSDDGPLRCIFGGLTVGNAVF